MTKARFRLVDTSVSRWYHCISRCCRKAYLLSDENGFQRKEWIDQRLKELNEIFAISVGGFSTMDNHLHLLLRMGAPLGARHLLCGEGRVGRIRF